MVSRVGWRLFLRPGLISGCAARSGRPGWLQGHRHAAHSGLDGREHGAMLGMTGIRQLKDFVVADCSPED